MRRVARMLSRRCMRWPTGTGSSTGEDRDRPTEAGRAICLDSTPSSAKIATAGVRPGLARQFQPIAADQDDEILTASQMREVDRLSTERYGIPSLLLMENAGSGVVRALESRFPDLAKLRIAICCGKGNNGGDGFVVVARN